MFLRAGTLEIEQDARELARQAGLRYVSDNKPGFTRLRKGEKYLYFNTKGEIIQDEKVISRINKLVIPHIWESVWISPHANSHLQATGIDKRNRKQYRYHKDWEKIRSENKFNRMLQFGEILPFIREKIDADLRKKSLIREKVLATVVKVLDETLIRIGNKEYEKQYKTYGLTTLKDKHIKNLGEVVLMEFPGKKSVPNKVIIKDKKLSSLIRKCKDLPGYDLFQYYDENGILTPVTSAEVNEYLKEISGEDVSAKDFRTWGGSSLAIKALLEYEKCEDEKTIKKNIVQVIRHVSGCLGNTPNVCRKYYVHPIIIEKYSAREILTFVEDNRLLNSDPQPGLSIEETIFMELLKANAFT